MTQKMAKKKAIFFSGCELIFSHRSLLLCQGERAITMILVHYRTHCAIVVQLFSQVPALQHPGMVLGLKPPVHGRDKCVQRTQGAFFHPFFRMTQILSFSVFLEMNYYNIINLTLRNSDCPESGLLMHTCTL